MSKRRAKLQAVASKAGVSIKTVSRVLNNEKYVKDETRKKVQNAIEILNYRPTRAARQLRSSKSFNIAIIYEPPGTEFLNGVMEGVFPICNEADYHVLLEPMPKEGKLEYIDRLISRSNLDGVIILPPESENHDLMRALDEENIKSIAIESCIAGRNTIGIDNKAAGFLVGQHLIEMGHERFAYISLSSDRISGNKRLVGLQEALKAANIPEDRLLIEKGDCTLESGYAAAKHLLSLDPRPTAIFAGNDRMAIGAMSCATDLNLKVPEDIAVCGFDDTELSRVFSPQLTTVTQPLTEYGFMAAKQLLGAINGVQADTQNLVIPFELKCRKSTLRP